MSKQKFHSPLLSLLNKSQASQPEDTLPVVKAEGKYEIITESDEFKLDSLEITQ